MYTSNLITGYAKRYKVVCSLLQKDYYNHQLKSHINAMDEAIKHQGICFEYEGLT